MRASPRDIHDVPGKSLFVHSASIPADDAPSLLQQARYRHRATCISLQPRQFILVTLVND
jgi:hypothetical protein